MTVWKLRAGDTKSNRNYAELCIANGVALLGADNLNALTEAREDPASDDEAIKRYCDVLQSQGGYFKSSASFVRRFVFEIKKDDSIILLHGSWIHAVGRVISNSITSLDRSDQLGLHDVDGWEAPFARAVEWYVPRPSGSDGAGHSTDLGTFSRDRFGKAPGREEDVNRILSGQNDGWQLATSSPDYAIARHWNDVQPPERTPLRTAVAPGVIEAVGYYKVLGDFAREHEVVTHAIVPFLRSLGWSDFRQIEIEGQFVDIQLHRTDDRSRRDLAALIEAKRFWSTVIGSRDQARKYAKDAALDFSSPVVTTTGGRWAVWQRTSDDSEMYLNAYGNLDAPGGLHPTSHPLLDYLAAPGEHVQGLAAVCEALTPPTSPGPTTPTR